MQLRLSVRQPGRAGTDLLVDADPASSVAALADRIGVALGRPAKDLFVDGIWLDPDLPLHLSPIRDGAELGLDAAAGDPNPRGILEVRVVGGPGAGAVWRLGPGEVTIGGAESDWIRLDDRTVPAAALRLQVAPDGTCTVTPAGATATLETAPVAGETRWPPRHLLAIGASLLEVATPEFPDAALRPSEDGAALDYARPPRLAPAPRVSQFALPSAPKANDRRPMPWVMAIVPLVGALVMAKIFGNLAFLAFAILSPVMVVGNHFAERRHGKRSHRETVAEYLARRARIEADAEDALTAEQAQRRDGYPDPAALGLIAAGPRHRLWERRRTDADRLDLRVGTGTLPSEVVLTDPDREEHERRDPLALHEVPVTVNLPAYGVLGIAGRAEQVRALGRWLVAQSAALHSPTDLTVCVLTDPAGAREWSWVSWLPHARPRDGEDAVALLGSGVETVGRRIAELQAQLNARQVALRQAGSGAVLDAPDVLVVLDGSRRLRAMPGVVQLLQDGPAVGIHVICLDTEERLLPEECRAVVTLDARGAARVSQTGAATVDAVRPDLVTVAWCERVARALAPLRDVSRDEDGAMPDSCRLLDVLGHEPPTGDRIAAGWLIGGRSTRAVLGLSVDGEFAIDLAKDGPHGLIAGTTGAGKSELLQTLIASLAVANRPDEMTFVLVDYKGGSAFAECAGLPHTVGMVTDLDPHLVTRALASLGAELRRREHVFADARVADLDRYLEARRRDPALAPMPRLAIVIDEFASLARELPDFVTGLVNVAQRGRSLGIHLILATQRPSGVVSNDIRANTNLRIALRVTDIAESQDVIDAADAARISKSTPGRAYVRLGHGSLLPFQAARIGGRRLPARPETDALPEPYVVPLTVDALGLPAPVRPATGVPDVAPVTDLAVLVQAIRAAAEQLNVPAQASPWLTPLPETVLLEDLAACPARAGDSVRPAPFALLDVPTEQAQRVEAIDLTEFGHLLVAGAARSGRSQVLRTIAASLARHNSAADVHLFGLDCGNGALLRLAELPHCGAIVRSSEVERAERLLDRLSTELRTRSALLGEGNVADITEQREGAAPGKRLAHIVLLLDRWEGFLPALGERDGGRLTDQVVQLLREGAGVGIHVVLAGDHTVLGGRIGSLTDRKIALRLADSADFTLIGLNLRTIPDSLPDGRAYKAGDGHQLQIALLDADPSGAAQGRAVTRIAAAALERDAEVPREQLPFGVDVLPARITFADAWTLQTGEPGALWGLVGVGGDRLTALGPDLAHGVPAFVIAGPSRSGRSTALCALAESYLATGTRLLLVAPRPSPLLGYQGRAGTQVLTGDLDPAVLAAAAGERLVVLVDDGELLRDSAAAAELTSILRRERAEQIGIVLAGDAEAVCAGFGGWQVEARKARRGLLLSPQNLTDADLIGARIPRSLVGRPVEPGRGLLHLGDGQLVAVQVPLP